MPKVQPNPFWKKLSSKYAPSLQPIDRFSEIIFGLIMVLTFTCSLSASQSGQQEIRTMLWTAIGCNIAWGIVDALMFLMTRLVDKAAWYQSINSIKTAKNEEEIRRSVKNALPPILDDIITVQQIDELHVHIKKLPDLPEHSPFTSKEFTNAGIIFLLVFTSTFPVIIPFLFLEQEPITAIRFSNGIAIALLFIAGYLLGRKIGYKPWLTGLLSTFIGFALVFITIALGG